MQRLPENASRGRTRSGQTDGPVCVHMNRRGCKLAHADGAPWRTSLARCADKKTRCSESEAWLVGGVCELWLTIGVSSAATTPVITLALVLIVVAVTGSNLSLVQNYAEGGPAHLVESGNRIL